MKKPILGDVRPGECERLVAKLDIRSDLCWGAGMAIGLGLTLIAARWFPYPQTRTGIFWAYAALLYGAWFAAIIGTSYLAAYALLEIT